MNPEEPTEKKTEVEPTAEEADTADDPAKPDSQDFNTWHAVLTIVVILAILALCLLPFYEVFATLRRPPNFSSPSTLWWIFYGAAAASTLLTCVLRIEALLKVFTAYVFLSTTLLAWLTFGTQSTPHWVMILVSVLCGLPLLLIYILPVPVIVYEAADEGAENIGMKVLFYSLQILILLNTVLTLAVTWSWFSV